MVRLREGGHKAPLRCPPWFPKDAGEMPKDERRCGPAHRVTTPNSSAAGGGGCRSQWWWRSKKKSSGRLVNDGQSTLSKRQARQTNPPPLLVGQRERNNTPKAPTERHRTHNRSTTERPQRWISRAVVVAFWGTSLAAISGGFAPPPSGSLCPRAFRSCTYRTNPPSRAKRSIAYDGGGRRPFLHVSTPAFLNAPARVGGVQLPAANKKDAGWKKANVWTPLGMEIHGCRWGGGRGPGRGREGCWPAEPLTSCSAEPLPLSGRSKMCEGILRRPTS